MTQSDWNLPALIDHTILRPEATKADVLRLCREARQYAFTGDLYSAVLHG
jgi:deoxyribose-phosphate aldolase